MMTTATTGTASGLFAVVGTFGLAVQDVQFSGGRIVPLLGGDDGPWTTDDEDLAEAVAAKVRASVGWVDVVTL